MRKFARNLLGAAVALPIAVAAPVSGHAQKPCKPCAPKAATKTCSAAKKTCGAAAKCGPSAKCGATKKCGKRLLPTAAAAAC